MSEMHPSESPSSTPDSLATQLPTPASTSKSKRNLAVLMIVGALACLCLTVAAYATISGVMSFSNDTSAVLSVLDEYMQAMAKKDIEAAIALFLDEGDKHQLKAQHEKMVEGPNFALFDQYQSLELGNANIGLQTGGDGEPEGTVAHVDGLVHYWEGSTGSFEAVLVKQDDQWRLYNFNIQIEPQKLIEYATSQP